MIITTGTTYTHPLSHTIFPPAAEVDEGDVEALCEVDDALAVVDIVEAGSVETVLVSALLPVVESETVEVALNGMDGDAEPELEPESDPEPDVTATPKGAKGIVDSCVIAEPDPEELSGMVS